MWKVLCSDFTCSPQGQVVVWTGHPEVGHHGGVGPLWTAVCGGAAVGARIQSQRVFGETLIEGLKFLCVEQRGDETMTDSTGETYRYNADSMFDDHRQLASQIFNI